MSFGFWRNHDRKVLPLFEFIRPKLQYPFLNDYRDRRVTVTWPSRYLSVTNIFLALLISSRRYNRYKTFFNIPWQGPTKREQLWQSVTRRFIAFFTVLKRFLPFVIVLRRWNTVKNTLKCLVMLCQSKGSFVTVC